MSPAVVSGQGIPGASGALPQYTIKNETDFPLKITMSVMDDPEADLSPSQNWIRISPASFELAPGSEKKVTAHITIPEDAALGDYSAFIQARSESINKTALNLNLALNARMSFTLVEPPEGIDNQENNSDQQSNSEKNPFVDLLEDHWAYAEVMTLYNKGIVSGFSDGTFKPAKTLTRAELAVMVSKALGLEANAENSTSFNDVPENHWAYNAAMSVAEAGIMVGNNNSFRPGDVLTREEMVQVVVNALHYKNGSSGDVSNGVLASFSDKDSIPKWARNAVAEAVNSGLIRGSADGKFGAGSKASRAQVSVLLAKMVEMI